MDSKIFKDLELAMGEVGEDEDMGKNCPVKPTDEVIGVLSDELRRLGCVMSGTRQEFVDYLHESQQKLRRVAERVDMLAAIFWQTVDREFGLQGKGGHSIRAGNQLVRTKEEEPTPPDPSLGL